MERLRTDQAMNEVNNQSNQCKMPSIQTSKKKKKRKWHVNYIDEEMQPK